MYPRLKPLALLLPALLALPAHAQQLALLDPVVVTATRFNEPDLASAANVTVITQEDIRNSGAATLPDALKYTAGVQVRALYGSIGADTAVDMRGFGEGASQRTLVLLNGQRLNPLDSTSVDWGFVPLDAVERIEIISGSTAVLYGDNAVGGVINIVTGAQRQGGSVQAGLGSNDGRQLAANFSHQAGPWEVALSANHQATDGWRANNKQERDNASARLGLQFDRGQAFVDIGWSRLDVGLPGALTRGQLNADPRQAQTPDSSAERFASFVRPGINWKLADNLDLALEVGYSELQNNSWVSNWASYDSRKTSMLSFTPRLQWRHGLGGLASTTTVGFDYYDGELTSDKSSSRNGPVTNTVRIEQQSRGFYLQNQTRLTSDLTLTVGGRHQEIDQSARDTGGQQLRNDHQESIGEAGLSYKVTSGLRLFARAGSTFRFANLDELTTFVGFVNQAVRPEKGRFVDFGGQWSGQALSLKLTAYNLDMTDEIAFNNSTFENENLAKTRHRGIEANASYEIDRRWRLSGGLNFQDAQFRDGPDRGKKIPLVADFQATAGIDFKPAAEWNLALRALHVGERHYGGDTANQYEKLPAYTTADFVATWHRGAWTARGRLLNLADVRYVPVGFNYYGYESYYPAEGRTAFADLRYDF